MSIHLPSMLSRNRTKEYGHTNEYFRASKEYKPEECWELAILNPTKKLYLFCQPSCDDDLPMVDH